MSIQENRVTILDVASEAGVSVSTVSRFVNKTSYVGRNTAKRIEGAIEKLQYVPNMSAQSLRSGASRNVLLVVPDMCNPFYSSMSKKVQQLLWNKSYIMTLFDSNEGVYEIEAIRLAKQMNASGILMASIDIKKEIIEELTKTHLPVVMLNAYEDNPFDTVHVHGIEGTKLAVSHLIMLGHKRIGFAGGTPHSMIGRTRRQGYEAAMAKAHLTILPEDVIEIGFSQSNGYEAGRYFANMDSLPTAICCANDQIALGLLAALQERNIRVPEEVSVTGMDDISYASISNPSLTSVTNDSAVFAEEGVRMLFERIDGTVQGIARDVTVRNELIIRGSVARPCKVSCALLRRRRKADREKSLGSDGVK